MPTSPLPDVCLIVKGPAASDPAFRSAVDAVRRDGAVLEIRVTYEEEDATRFAREATHLGIPRIVAAGGDGTVNEVVCGVLAAQEELEPNVRPCVGLVPMGTANDFARTIGAPLEDRHAALRLALEGAPRDIDVGRVNDRPFVNVSSCGLGAEIVAETPLGLKRLLGGAAYSIAALRRLLAPEPTPLTVTGPDLEWSGDALIVAVGNARTAGGGYRVCGRAALDDGLLDVLIVHDAPVESLASLFTSLVEFGPEGRYEGFVYAQVPHLNIEAPNGLHVNVDGEPSQGTSFAYTTQARALRFAVGETRALVD